MNASGTIRADFVRTSRLSFHTGRISQMKGWPNFTTVDHLQWREKCETERNQATPAYDPSKVENGSFPESDFDDGARMSREEKFKRIFTTFPYRDPTWLVAMFFVIGSIDFTINAFFGLLPLVAPETTFETEATVAFPATIFIGATMFTIAGIVDFFGAFNADRGAVEIAKNENGGKDLHHHPALLGSRDWIWIPPRENFVEILLKNKPFQAGLMQLTGGAFFITSAFTGLLGFIDPTDPNFPLLAFGPQVIGGSLFFFANMMLAICYEQDRWWKPKPLAAGWQAAVQSAIGGAGFTLSPLFLFQNRMLESAVTTFVGSWAFLVGSVLGLYVTMEYC